MGPNLTTVLPETSYNSEGLVFLTLKFKKYARQTLLRKLPNARMSLDLLA